MPKKIKELLLILLIFSLGFFVRFYNFEERLNFGPEQAISLITSADYLTYPTLLGLPSVQRSTSTGLTIFFGPLFNYSLVPLLLLFKFDPVPITAYFALINILTAVFLFWLTKKIFNFQTAVFASALFLFNSTMISHSLFIWIVNYLPLISVAILYLFLKFKATQKGYLSLLIGLLTGVSFGLEYMFLLTGVPIVVLFLLKISKNRLRDAFLLLVGFILGNLPTVIFDLRHNFYNLQTLWLYLIDTINTPGQNKLSYYHFLQFWPLACLAGAVLLSKIYKKSVLAGIFLIILYAGINLAGQGVSFNSAVGMSEGLNYPKLDQAARTISSDNPESFNIATTYDFDTRAHSLRYLITYRYHKAPLGITDYPNSKNLYVLSRGDYSFLNTPWEISSFNAQKIEVLDKIDPYRLYKLTK